MGKKKRNTKVKMTTARPNHGPRPPSISTPWGIWTSTATATLQVVDKDNMTVHLHVRSKSKEGKQLQRIISDLKLKEVNVDTENYSLILEMDGAEYSFIDILNEIATPIATLSFQVMARILVKLEELERDIKKLTDKPE